MNFIKTAVAVALFAGVAINANAADTKNITLSGIIVESTCDIELNNGAAILNVGTYKSQDFEANKQQGEVPLPVALTECTDGESGFLKVTGETSNGNNQIFTEADGGSVGFMMTYEGTPVVNGVNTAGITITGTEFTNTFIVGMASTAASPAPGDYTAPITVAYVVQ